MRRSRDKTFIARTPVIPGVNDDEEHIRAVLAFIRPYKNVIDYELLPYHRFGESKYGFLGRVYELEDFNRLDAETLQRLQAIIDEAFGRSQGIGRSLPRIGVRSNQYLRTVRHSVELNLTTLESRNS